MLGPSTGALSRLSNRAYGVVFLVVVALLAGLSVAAFQKRFTPVTMVTLLTDHVGSQLSQGSDVKLRGLIVGEVRSVESRGHGARLELALEPSQVAQIPADVQARLLPKTLFGERYVSLVAPDAGHPARHISEGATIPQDRSSAAIELEKVFDDLLPLLRTVEPARLATTLNALATTLDGRGARLGKNLVAVDDYLRALNPRMPAIQADISGLADLASTYAVAAPELVRAARALVTTSRTLVEKKDQLAGFLAGTAGFANTASGFLEANEQRIIQTGRVSRPTLAVLARYSPEYPCMAAALTNWIPLIGQTFASGSFHITLEVTPQRQGYHPGEEPSWQDDRGPQCYGLPDHHGDQEHPYPGQRFRDGTDGAGTSAPLLSALPSAFASPAGADIADPDSGLAGTTAEQQVVAALLGTDTGPAAPSAITTLLAGPVLRGTVVSQQ